MIPLSVLDLTPVTVGSTPRQALRNSLDLAKHAESLGYHRYWVAEHHNMTGIASAATAVVVGYLAAGTSNIRVGSGGIMLPNHSPLVIAEQFGTLESLYPGRIDLGLGRAPGSDQVTMRALRRNADGANVFPRDVQELRALFEPVEPGQVIQAVPGGGLRVPLWILGSSLFGAGLAAALGLPYAFASHFAPAALDSALASYREQFRASSQLEAPYAMVGINVCAADTDAEAQKHFTTTQQAFANLQRARPGPYQAPIDDIESYWTPTEKIQAERMLALSVVGSATTVKRRLTEILAQTRADELIVQTTMFDHQARKRSYEILAQVAASMA